MIVGLCHPGSGLGNQLFRMVQARVLALDKGFDYGIAGRENFKGKSFMNFDFGKEVPFPTRTEFPAGKLVVESNRSLFEEKTGYFNPETHFIEDNTTIDGEFQDERYFEHRLKEIDEWLKVEPIEVPDNLCIMGFRGGEYALYPELFLPFDYWVKAMEEMRSIEPLMRFRVVTDDPALAKEFFRGLEVEITHDIGMDWRQVRYAKCAIIANSSFYILPRLLRHHWNWADALTIAPRYWARHNTGEWSMPANFYRSFRYI